MTIAARLNTLDERERKLLGVLGWVAGVLLILVVPILVVSTLSSKKSANNEYRDVITAIEESRSTMNERKAQHDALLAKYSNATPPLAGFIEQAAKSQSIAAADTQDKPETPHGKRYSERFTVVKMHKIAMRPFVEMLQQIESSGHPVTVSRLNIKPRPSEPDQYEIELGVSAFDRKGDAKESGAKAAASAAPSASPSADAEPEDQ